MTPFAAFLGRLGLRLLVAATPLAPYAGGPQELQISAGPQFAGTPYLVLSSVSGSTPGLPLGPSLALPLNYDTVTLSSLLGANSLPFLNTFANLDASGRANATFVLPSGLSAGLVGAVVTHATLLLDTVFLEPFVASDAVTLTLTN